MHFGGDYNPEQWPEEIWREDVRLMREAGVTMVTVGVFSWSRIQPEEGVFNFEWLDTVLDLLHAKGIRVDLATATASPPPWAAIKYPEMLPQDENGVTRWPGSRQVYAPTSATYLRLAGELVRAIAERYATHPAVEMWHINNELGCHMTYDYSDNARDAFRVWLERKYKSISELNQAWTTDFWSQRYAAFDQIFPPRATPAIKNPSMELDFKRFSSDALLNIYRMERDIVRRAGGSQPITTNFMGTFPGANYWQWAAELDIISNDSYPDPNEPDAFRSMAFDADLMRSLKPATPWLLMEQSTNAVQWRPTNAPKAPGEMAAWSMQNVARGADGVLFFQWRQSRGGAEKYHSAMLPHSGTDTRVWREITGLGRDLGSLPELGVPEKAKVALVFDWESMWALYGPGHLIPLDYVALLRRWHAAVQRLQIAVDLVPPDADLRGYDLVIAPHLYLLREDDAHSLTSYVESGGTLFVSAFTDVVDENDRFRAGGYLQGLGAALGIRVEEFGALVPPDSTGPGEKSVVLESPVGSLRGEYLAEEIHADGAEIIGRFTEGRLKGGPALTLNRLGKGEAIYLATIPDDAGMADIMTWVCGRIDVEPVLSGVSDRVDVVQRGDLLTIVNFEKERVSISVDAFDVASGAHVTTIDLEPFEWSMLRTRQE